MIVLFHNIYDEINQNNTLFERENVAIGDNLLKPFNLIAVEALKHGIMVGTYAKIRVEDADFFVFIDYPKKDDRVFKYATEHKKKMFLISYESPIISKAALKTELHSRFLKVFTWSDALVASDPEQYVKLNYLHDIKVNFNVENKRHKNFIIIAGNKINSAPNELYSLRYKCIKWFQKHHPAALDLYGFGWNLKAFDDNFYIGKLFNHYNAKYQFIKAKLSVYRGLVARKSDILKDYNFSICFENVYGHDGYITEKIFDCLLAGTIPIYKGAPNINKYIPQDCFLQFDAFASIDAMYHEVTQMPEERIRAYRENIKSFLLSSKTEPFRATYLADILISNILKYQ
ncbi:MAG TPA: glycosyltransferase family 10 [Mucilaginibacter sp.]